MSIAKSASLEKVVTVNSRTTKLQTAVINTKSGTQHYALEKVDIPMYLDGKRVNLLKPSVIMNGSTLVPLRSVFEAMGITVNWDADNQAVIAEKAGTRLTMKPGDNTAKLNDKTMEMETSGQIIEGSTYVPLRFVGESFSALIGYDQNTRTISISTKSYQKATVTYLPDGDTLDARFENGDTRRIRLIGVNTTESTKEAGIEPGGKAASAYSKSRLLGQTVYVTRDKTDDPYGRMLAYVHLENGEFFNATLVSEGYARVMTIAPNTIWSSYFDSLQDAAKKEKRRIWNPNMYADLEPAVASKVIKDLAEAGINKTASQLATPTTEGEFAKLLLLTLYPEARLLMTGYKIYEISKDENTQRIIQALMNKESNGELLNNEQMHSLILLALGLEEDSFAAKTLDNLGLMPNLDRPVTVGEAAGIIQKIKVFVPSIGEFEQKMGAINPDIRGSVDGVLSGFSDMNLTDKAKDASGWIKDKTSGLFGKNPTDEEAKQAEESAKQKAADITKQIAEDAFRIFDHK
ncbi:stalk domain-containing protein [Paenibacillus alginolyticus]|uniref:stalk domain-containing protein n=1 Tax=Paenibacillus alginolyticus TaxID=59839 RepID=UPI000FDB8D05|nr:stalk domain-containing protein [Paenibacillus alginolyticus]MCY9666367.1 stalk domain-containing protein [Paenibacillus alginolyticus]